MGVGVDAPGHDEPTGHVDDIVVDDIVVAAAEAAGTAGRGQVGTHGPDAAVGADRHVGDPFAVDVDHRAATQEHADSEPHTPRGDTLWPAVHRPVTCGNSTVR